ncbi:MAG: ComF family protein [Betaproteobacteria bacterium]
MPLPLSAQRLAERGFNQAWELARTLHRLSGCKAQLQTRLLLRTRHTLAQSQLDRAQRLANVRDAFLTEPLAPDCVRGRAVVLVDDVMTSGATLNAAAQSLLQAGAKGVQALVVARTPS